MSVCLLAIVLDGGSSGKLQVGLDLNVRDGLEETALGLAIWTEQFDTAERLLQMGAELEAGGGREEEEEGERGGEPGLLYVAIVREKQRACLFLLDHGADFKTRYTCSTWRVGRELCGSHAQSFAAKSEA